MGNQALAIRISNGESRIAIVSARRMPRKPPSRRSTRKSAASSEGYNEATRILTEKRADLEALAKGLLEFETLTGDEIIDLLNGKKPNRESVLEPQPQA
jgi:hypothetical protein